MDKLRKWLTILINIFYIPIGAYLFSINNETVVLQWISEINVFLSDKHYITYDKLNKFLFDLSWWSIILFIILKVIRFLLKSDIRKLEKQNKILLLEKQSQEKDKINLQRKYEILEKDSVFLKENFDNTLKGFLTTFARNVLNFGTLDIEEKNNERITFFTYDKKRQELTLQVRYSANKEYDKNGKMIYDADRGIIGKALKNDEFFDNDFPRAYIKENEMNPEYISYHRSKYKLTVNEVKNLTMKSTFMYAYAIKHEGSNIGVVTIESTHENRYEEKFLHKIMEEHRKTFKHFMMYAIRNKVRENLQEEGF